MYIRRYTHVYIYIHVKWLFLMVVNVVLVVQGSIYTVFKCINLNIIYIYIYIYRSRADSETRTADSETNLPADSETKIRKLQPRIYIHLHLSSCALIIPVNWSQLVKTSKSLLKNHQLSSVIMERDRKRSPTQHWRPATSTTHSLELAGNDESHTLVALVPCW